MCFIIIVVVYFSTVLFPGILCLVLVVSVLAQWTMLITCLRHFWANGIEVFRVTWPHPCCIGWEASSDECAMLSCHIRVSTVPTKWQIVIAIVSTFNEFCSVLAIMSSVRKANEKNEKKNNAFKPNETKRQRSGKPFGSKWLFFV